LEGHALSCPKYLGADSAAPSKQKAAGSTWDPAALNSGRNSLPSGGINLPP
jgi:hypothetical protein